MNGFIERFYQTLKGSLIQVVNEKQKIDTLKKIMYVAFCVFDNNIYINMFLTGHTYIL